MFSQSKNNEFNAKNNDFAHEPKSLIIISKLEQSWNIRFEVDPKIPSWLVKTILK